MKSFSNTRATSILVIAIVACFVGSLYFLRQIDASRGSSRIRESLYISSPSALKRISLGYTGLLADIYWTRAVQYFGSQHRRSSEEYNLLAPLLDITTTLDPKLIVAYRFGAIFLSEQPPAGAGQPEKAVALVEKGIGQNPNDWRLYYDLGYLHAWELRDYLAASKAFARGAEVPGSNPSLRVLAAAYASRGGDFETSMLMWRTTYETTENQMIRENALFHLHSLQADQDMTKLEELLQTYQAKTGHFPDNFRELISAGLLKGVPLDPTGRPYKLLSGGRIEVQDPDALPFITQGAPPGWRSKLFVPDN